MIQRSERRQRTHSTRRDAFLEATRQLIEERGIEALTIKAVADRVDAAVGTLYTYFPSKGALVAALQVEAIERLDAAYAWAADRLDLDLAARSVDVDTSALARLVAFGRSLIAVTEVLPQEFRLQQRLLSAQVEYEDRDLGLVAPVAFALLARPERLLRDASALGLIDEGDEFDRTIAWVAGINGVITLGSLTWPGAEGFDPTSLADMLHLDLLRGWGADPELLAAADACAPLGHMAMFLRGFRR
ncbi:MAG: helix-turn-helix domain-containing protein [Acidimicrobiales bacterium]